MLTADLVWQNYNSYMATYIEDDKLDIGSETIWISFP